METGINVAHSVDRRIDQSKDKLFIRVRVPNGPIPLRVPTTSLFAYAQRE